LNTTWTSDANRWHPGDAFTFETLAALRSVITGEMFLEDRVVPTAEFDPDLLERLMVAVFELLGRPRGEAQELARSILKAAERPQSSDRGPPDRDPT
jgi:hypothetical protein